jgi:hypothetical protein
LTTRNEPPVGKNQLATGTGASRVFVEPEITIPSKDDETGPDMRIYDPPHEALKLEEDICDVEYRQQPAVSVAREM